MCGHLIKGFFYLLILFGWAACADKDPDYVAPQSDVCQGMSIEGEYIVFNKDGSIELNKEKPGSGALFYESNYRIVREDLSFLEPTTEFSHNNDWSEIGVDIFWDQGIYGQNILVAVVDSGVDTTSPYLEENWGINESEGVSLADHQDNDNNGFVDDWNGWNFITNNDQQHDEVHHGTVIAHLIAGNSSTPGGQGVAPGAKILPLDFMDGNGGDVFSAIRAIEYGISRGAKIINNSWFTSCSTALKEKYKEWEQQDVLFIQAAGNDSLNLDEYPLSSSTYSSESFLAVGSIDPFLFKTTFSNYGSSVAFYTKGTDIAAVGKNFGSGEVILVSGTSYSAAIASGVAALAWSAHPDWSSKEVKLYLEQNSRRLYSSDVSVLILDSPDLASFSF